MNRLRTLDKMNTKRAQPKLTQIDESTKKKQERADIKRSLSTTGQDMHEMTKIEFSGLQKQKRKADDFEDDKDLNDRDLT